MKNTITALCLILIAGGSLVYGQSYGTQAITVVYYHTFSDGMGTSSNFGVNTTYHSFSDGTSSTSSNYGGNTS